ncbi:MAG: MFS transporter, partial [Actinomyces graevenitzii]|nr:MFS transporter [Actinomyces graevenitzii]
MCHMQTDEEVLLPAPLSEQAALNPYVLGATLNDDGVDFVVNAPGASAVDLCLIDGEGADLRERRIGMHDHLTGSWSAHISGLGPGQRYGYRVYGPWNPNEGLRYNPRKFLLDPYAKALATKAVLDDSLYAHKVNEHGLPTRADWEISELDSLPYAAIGVVADPNYQPVAPSPRISADQRVIYETHVVGLTKQLEAIPEDLRGTYAGVAHPVMIEHLKNLGVTTIELLPIHAKFDEPWLTRRGLSNYWGYATSIATLVVALCGPVLGTISDFPGWKKKLFSASVLVGALGCVGLGVMSSWLWFLVLFVLAKSAYSVSLVIYDSMLTDITQPERMDKVSANGYAWGYIGSCIPFVLSLVLVLCYEPLGMSVNLAMALAFLLIAAWWLLLSVPLWRSYEQKHSVPAQGSRLGESFHRLGGVFSELSHNRKALFFLIAFFFYIDGVYTIIDM